MMTSSTDCTSESNAMNVLYRVRFMTFFLQVDDVTYDKKVSFSLKQFGFVFLLWRNFVCLEFLFIHLRRHTCQLHLPFLSLMAWPLGVWPILHVDTLLCFESVSTLLPRELCKTREASVGNVYCRSNHIRR